MRFFSFTLLTVFCLAAPASARDSSQDDSERLEELRHQVGIMERVRELDGALVAIRDHIRPTSVVEKRTRRASAHQQSRTANA